MMYRFKYLPNNTSLYAVTLSAPHGVPLFSRQRAFLTQVMKSKTDERHVVVAFHTDAMVKYKLQTILSSQRHNIMYHELEELPPLGNDPVKLHLNITNLGELKLHCDMLALPLLVYANVYCDLATQMEVYETYFHHNLNQSKH